METVKIKDINNGVVKEVKKSLASDFIGTGRFELVVEKPATTSKNNKFEELSEDKKSTSKWK